MKTKIFFIILMFIFSGVYATDLSLCQKKEFLITWYYSPKPWQSFYSKGTYELEVRLNWNWTHWASWVPVFNGMIAWPKSYSFGTFIYLPSFGLGKIQDRWWAIVKAGDRGQSYDRLDIWMGEWDEGLARALNFGKRKITWYVCDDIEMNIWFDFTSIKLGSPNKSSSSKLMFNKAFDVGEVHPEVKILQQALINLGYYSGSINSTYDAATIDAVYHFQLDNNIVNRADIDAWYFGEKTREILTVSIQRYNTQQAQKIIEQKQQQSNICKDNEKSSPDFTSLQENLNILGYKCEKTWIYDTTTIQAVRQFQLDNNLLPKWDKLLWTYWTKTKEKILAAIKIAEQKQIFKRAFEKWEKNDEIILLQKYLNALGYKCEKTWIYDSATIQSIYQFQLEKNLLPKWDKLGGYFGSKTREKFNEAIDWLDPDASNKEQSSKLNLAELKQNTWDNILKKWIISDDVLTIKQSLAKLWYFTWKIDTTFDSALFTWVIKFQLEKNLLPNGDQMLGIIGSKTKEKILEYSKIYDEQHKLQLASLRKENLKKSFDRSFKTWEKDSEIKRLQDCLLELGYYNDELNGVYNDKTAWAIYQFQLDNNLLTATDIKAKGNFWPKTRQILTQKVVEKLK